MNSKKKLSNCGLILISLIAILSFSCGNSNDQEKNKHQDHEKLIYTCPMHPEVESPEPGNCPKCNMKLVEKKREVLELNALPRNAVLSDQSTVKLSSPADKMSVDFEGYIDLDITRNRDVSVPFAGRLEKLFVKYDFQYVKKGEKIAELYSRELNTMQEEHLFLMESRADKVLLDQSRKKLQYLGFTNEQLNELESKRTVSFSISIFSPSSGYVSFVRNLNSLSGVSDGPSTSMKSMKGTMKSSGTTSFITSDLPIREGSYVNKGDLLFSLNDLETVWAIVSVPGEYLISLRKGDSVRIQAENNPYKSWTGKYLLSEPFFQDKNQRFVRVRIELPNPSGELMLNAFVMADFPVRKQMNYSVPQSAVCFTGMSAYVWVKTGITPKGAGIFALRKVVATASVDGKVSIMNGLTPEEEIALDAGYLTDSEAILKNL